MRKDYATSLSRPYLEYLGITHISEDGKEIYRNGKLIKQSWDGQYMLVTLYDPIIRESIPKEKRLSSSGQITLGAHRIVYAWYKGFIQPGFVVDHIDGNKLNNHIGNLQVLTPKENLYKARKDKEMKIHPLPKTKKITYEICENLLNECLKNYEEAKQNHDSKLAHKLRGYKVKYESWMIQLKQS